MNYMRSALSAQHWLFSECAVLAVLHRAEMTKRARRVLYGAAVLIFAGVALPIGGMAFNYFTLPTQRYTFVLMPILLLLMAWMWDYMRKGGRLNLVLILGSNCPYGMGIQMWI